MTENLFASSDSVRNFLPLKHARIETFDEPLELARGGRLDQVQVTYETYGRLNDRRDNAVLICHALSGDSHAARHDEDDDPGWWDVVVGPGKAIDTDKYFVICPNLLGGCRGTTGPNSTNPATGRPYGADFPVITIADMVNVQRRLLDRLGIERLLAVIGGSMGGQLVLNWATEYPDRIRGAIPIATSARLSSQALAFDIVGRNAIMHDPKFQDGQYYDRGETPDVGLAIARMIGHITYLSREAMRDKFETRRTSPRDVAVSFEKEFSVGSYLGYQGAKFVKRFDANSYVTLTMAMDLFDIGATPQELSAALAKSRCSWLVMSFASDWLFSPQESRVLVDALVSANKSVSYCNVASDCGHDAFLLEDDLELYGGLICAFLASLSGDRCLCTVSGNAYSSSPTSIFCPAGPQRLDYDHIVELVGQADSVLDLGCGGGELLARLKAESSRRTVGVELDENAILACLGQGLEVIQIDLNEGALPFADKRFDCVVLSQTLQAIRDVRRVVDEMLRVGSRCIVSLQNFAYRKLRDMLYHQGRAPEAPGLLRYKWYDSPNIRFCSIKDFEIFCRDEGITVHKCVCLDSELGRQIVDDPNRNADLAIFMLSRP